MSEPQFGHPQYSRRGWKIAGLGLLITFNYAFAFLLPVIDLFFDDGYSYLYWSIFTVTIGTPIAFVGLLLSIWYKWRIGKKRSFLKLLFWSLYLEIHFSGRHSAPLDLELGIIIPKGGIIPISTQYLMFE